MFLSFNVALCKTLYFTKGLIDIFPIEVSKLFEYPNSVHTEIVFLYPVLAVCFSHSLSAEILPVNPANVGAVYFIPAMYTNLTLDFASFPVAAILPWESLNLFFKLIQ